MLSQLLVVISVALTELRVLLGCSGQANGGIDLQHSLGGRILHLVWLWRVGGASTLARNYSYPLVSVWLVLNWIELITERQDKFASLFFLICRKLMQISGLARYLGVCSVALTLASLLLTTPSAVEDEFV